MNRYEEFAKYILHVEIDEEFKVVDKNNILVNDKRYRINSIEGFQTFEPDEQKWRKVLGIYEHFIEGIVKPCRLTKNDILNTKFLRRDILQDSVKVLRARENFKNTVYNKILNGDVLRADEASALVYKTPGTIYHWEQEGIVPPAEKNEFGRRIYDLEGLCVFLEHIVKYPWQKRHKIDMEEIESIYKYIKAKKETTKVVVRDRNANPYEYKGVNN